MAEPLLFTVCQDPAGLAAVCTGAVLLAQVAVGWVFDRRVPIAGSWADGRDWARTARVRVAAVARVGGLWLLVHVVLRAHGRHRAVA